MAEFNNLTMESISIIDSDEDNKSLINQQQSKYFNNSTYKNGNNLFKNKLILKLDLNFRDKLIQLLNEYTKSLISNGNISINRKELKKCKSDLIKLLTKTPSKLNKELNSSKFIINLNYDIRYKIIDLLIRNENIIIDSKDKIDSNCGNQLIEENNQLINKLNNQSVEFINNNDLVDNDEESNEEDSNDEDSNDEKTNDEDSNDEKTNDKDVINSKKQSDDQILVINSFKKQLDDQSLEINRLKKQSDDQTFSNSNSITLNFVKKDINIFLNFESSEQFKEDRSKSITFKNVNWYLETYSFPDGKLRFVLVGDYLASHLNPIKLEYIVDAELILKSNKFNQKESSPDKVLKCNDQKRYIPGKMRFEIGTMYKDELLDDKNGFIKDDSIEVEVQWTVNSILKLKPY